MSQRRSEGSSSPAAAALAGSPSAPSTAGLALFGWVQRALPVSQAGFKASLGAL